jgi:hypothetical protein
VTAIPADLAGRLASGQSVPAGPAAGHRVLLQTARFEAVRLTRSPLVVAGALASAGFIWWNNFRQVPLWWAADAGVGAGLLLLAGGVLMAAQLAAGRAKRDGMTQLYDSCPAPASARSGGLLLGIAGPVLLAAAVTLAAVGWLDTLGPAGSPRPAVLAGGLTLVALGGAAGTALGTWRPHPLLGFLAAIVLALVEWDVVSAFDGWKQITGPDIWLLPWTWNSAVLSSLPGGAVPIPPAGWHLAELAALTGLAALAALARTWPRRRTAAVLTAALVAVAGWSGWAQDKPVSVAAMSALVYQVTHPVQAQQCITASGVRYCYYPAFAPLVSRWQVPVNGVLGLLPRPAASRRLVIRQLDEDLDVFPPLAPVTPDSAAARQLLSLGARADNFGTAATSDPHLIPGESQPPVYTGLSWGLGSRLGSSQAELAALVADWAVGLPTTAPMVSVQDSGGVEDSGGSYTEPLACVPLSQAREAIAIWLAASATPVSRAAFGPPAKPGLDTPQVQVGKIWIYDPGWTMQGLTLANEMLTLPRAAVRRELAARWADWLRPSATDAQLAAALGVRPVAVQRAPTPRPDGQLPGTNAYMTIGPPSPVCR